MNKITSLIVAVLCTSALTAQIPDYLPTDGLEAWYPFNGNANDESGNGLDATPQGTISLAEDRFGNELAAYYLEGVNSTFSSAGGHILLPEFNMVDWTSFTISIWVFEEEVYNSGESFIEIGYSPQEITIRRSGGGGIPFQVHDGWGVSGSEAVDPWSYQNEWTHYCMTYSDVEGLKAFVNGQLVGEVGPYSGVLNPPTEYAAIGRHWWAGGSNTSTRFTGKVDDVGIWNRVLSPIEIAALVNPDAQVVCGNLPQGIAPNTGGWEYNDFFIPEGYRVDSIYAEFNRPGFPVETQDFSWSFCPGCDEFNYTDNIGAFAYQEVDTSLYDGWIDLTVFEEFVGPGVGRAIAPTNAGVEWIDLCYALSPVETPEDPCTPSYLTTGGLIAWYPFCGNANDFSGNELHGTVYGASLTVNRFGEAFSAYSFDGVDDYIEVPDNPVFDFGANDFSVSLWVNKKQPSDLQGAGCHCAGVNQWYGAADEGLNEWSLSIGNDFSDEATFAVETDSGVQLLASSESIPLGSWTHLVGVRDGSDLKIYVDGSLSGTLNIGEEALLSIDSNILIAVLGKAFDDSNNNLFSFADLDDIAIYNRALSEEEIGNLYAPEVCAPCLVNYSAGDLNCNGTVSIDDLLIFLTNFGEEIE